jgi:hypothetical protein
MTKSAMHLKILASVLLAIAGSASATTYTNVPGGATSGLPFAYFGNHPNPSGDSPQVGEVFSLTSAETLSSFSFYALGDQSALPLQLTVAYWYSGLTSPGTTMLTSTTAIETFDGSNLTTLKFDNLGLGLLANTNYIAYLTTSSPTASVQLSRVAKTADVSGFGISQANYSNVSNSWVLGPNSGFLALQYTAVTAVPEPESLAMLLTGMGLIGAAVARRKVKQA